MTAAGALRRQQELQAAQRERHDGRCSRDDCSQRLVPNSTGDLCARHWKLANGFSERDMRAFRDAPGPPTGMSHGIDQPTNPDARKWWVASGCLLCGGPAARVDQRGVERGPATVTRQLIGLIDGVPFLTGSRCGECEKVVRANRDRLHPVVSAVTEMLGRPDFDIWGLHVVAARMAGLDDPEPPAERWGFTEIGPRDTETTSPAPLSSEELAKLRTLLLQR